MSDEKKPEESPAGAPTSAKRFMLLWFAIPIVVMIVLAFLK
jgi:hypothetical protein